MIRVRKYVASEPLQEIFSDIVYKKAFLNMSAKKNQVHTTLKYH